MSRILLLITAIGAAFLARFWNTCPQCHSMCPSQKDETRAGYLNYDCAGKPHQSSWASWFHPERRNLELSSGHNRAGAVTEDWNILYHLGGVGPWVEKTIDVVEGGVAAPDGCEVEQVHMVRRLRKPEYKKSCPGISMLSYLAQTASAHIVYARF
jgi:acid phosphatase